MGPGIAQTPKGGAVSTRRAYQVSVPMLGLSSSTLTGWSHGVLLRITPSDRSHTKGHLGMGTREGDRETEGNRDRQSLGNRSGVARAF